jgi:hypothetical protein
MKLCWLLPIVGTLAACGYRTPLDPAGLGPTGVAGAGSGNPGDQPSPGGGLGTDDAGHGACYGTCMIPPGPVQPYPTLDELAAALVGVWQICTGGHALFGGAPSDTIGVEFAPSSRVDDSVWAGDLYFLKRTSAGPARGDGPSYHQSYRVVIDSTVTCRSDDDKTGSWFELMYSSCPREWWLSIPGGPRGTLASF